MKVIRTAWRTLPWATRTDGSSARAGRRWRARLVGALMAGAFWVFCGTIWEFYHRGPLTFRVKRADLVVSFWAGGTVESADNVDVKNRVPGWRNILQIVPDGSYVRQGDLLLRLDRTSLDETIVAERAALTKAEAAMIRAKKSWQAARIAVDEYGEGTYVQKQLELSRGILEAQRRLTKAEHSLLQVQIMHRMAFISSPHVEAMKLAVEKAQGDLAAAKTKKDILEGFTRAKVLAELASKRDTAEAQLRSEEAIVRRKTARIARLEEDVQNCEIRAPRGGMVVYASDTAGTNPQASQIYQGARVRQYQTLVRLANLDRMQVRIVVPRSKLADLHRGQRAYVRVLDEELHGEVSSIADRPEPSPAAGSHLKQFAVAIAVDDRRQPLKPGLSAEVEILLQHRADALVIPLLCVVDERGRPCVRVRKRGGELTREVMLGIANDALVEVLEGVSEGDSVVLNPQR